MAKHLACLYALVGDPDILLICLQLQTRKRFVNRRAKQSCKTAKQSRKSGGNSNMLNTSFMFFESLDNMLPISKPIMAQRTLAVDRIEQLTGKTKHDVSLFRIN